MELYTVLRKLNVSDAHQLPGMVAVGRPGANDELIRKRLLADEI